MSHVSSRPAAASHSTLTGFSVGSGIGILIAALVTGGLISLYTENIGWPFLAVFAAAAVVVVTFVDPKGLFLTVASIPVLYTFFLLLTGGLSAYFDLPEGQTSIGRTQAVLILYPLLQYYPVLLVVTLGALFIAVARYRLLKRHNEEILRREEMQRRRASETNRKTRREATRSRERTRSSQSGDSRPVSVSELVNRTRNEKKSSARRVSRRLSDDLYSPEQPHN